MRRDAQSIKLERYQTCQRTSQTIRAGLQLERAHGVLQSAFPSGVQYDFGGARTTSSCGHPVQGAAFSTQGLWAEDQLTLGNRLTLTAGLRYDT